MEAVKCLGNDVYYIAYDNSYVYLVHNNERRVIKKNWFGNMKGYIHTKAFYDLFDSAYRILKNEKFDIVYMRRCSLSRK